VATPALVRLWRVTRQRPLAVWLSALRSRLRGLVGGDAAIFFRPGPGDLQPCPAVMELDLETYRRLTPASMPPWSPEAVGARFAQGHRLFALCRDDQPVSYAWVRRGRRFQVGELGGKTAVSDVESVWIWDCVTPPPKRGRGYYPQLLDGLLYLFQREDVIIFCGVRNHASVRGIGKSRFTPWIRATAFRWGTWSRTVGDFPARLRFE
jgi:hypothetical protein